ncbi:hypothetical protein, partial [Lutibacter sp.]|uniref:Ig-like domain-containing protein n=1 Tax=Lutibacter sp. TaxID=1925666 RepID=UPI00356736DC
MLFKKYTTFFVVIFLVFLYDNSWSQTNLPPTITATGNQIYCPLTQLHIATDFNIVDIDNTPIEAIFIQISTGYIQGEDELKYLGSNPNITSSWNSSQGKLTLKLPTAVSNYIDLLNAVKEVVFESNSNLISGEKHFSFTIDEANYLPSTGHYYEYIENIGITWTAAKTAAEGKDYYGLQGYLATITSIEEAQLSGEQAAGAGWIGGSDATTEGVWKWVTGPAPENGMVFWNGLSNGSSPLGIFSFWNTGEPNQTGDEDYAHVTAPGVGVPGSWNDLSNNGAASGNYQPKGYIVEYGGMPGDPILNISASTKITVDSIGTIASGSNCGEGSVFLSATTTLGETVLWFDSLITTTPIGSGLNFTTPLITTTTTYYVSAGVCLEGQRTPIIATIYSIPEITSTTDTKICGAGSGTLLASASAGIINWYTTLTGGLPIATGNNYTPSVINTTTFYVDATENGCTTLTRTPVVLNVQYTTEPTGISTQEFCDIENATLNELVITGTAILWYNSLAGGTPLSNADFLINNTTYYASQTVNGCESPTRLAVDVHIFETPNPPSTITILEKCDDLSIG